MAKRVIGVYDTESEVIEAVNNLNTAGYTPEDITIIANNSDETNWIRSETNYGATTSDDWIDPADRHEDDESFWEKVKNFFGSESDAYDGRDGYISSFTHYGLTNEDAERYNAEVERGKIVLLAPEEYAGTTNATAATSELTMDTERNTEHKMKLREEELDIDKHEVSAGEVEIRKEVHVDTKQIDVPVTHEEIYIDRKPVNKDEVTGTFENIENETIRVPLKEEEIEVRKRPVVREEVEIGKKKVHETEQVSDTVRREELNVNVDNSDKTHSNYKEPDAVYLEEDEKSFAREQAKRNRLFNDEDDRL